MRRVSLRLSSSTSTPQLLPPLSPPTTTPLYHAVIGSILHGTAVAGNKVTTNEGESPSSATSSDLDLVSVYAYSNNTLSSALPSQGLPVNTRHISCQVPPQDAAPWLAARFPSIADDLLPPTTTDNTNNSSDLLLTVDSTQWELGQFCENVMVGKGLEALCSPHTYVDGDNLPYDIDDKIRDPYFEWCDAVDGAKKPPICGGKVAPASDRMRTLVSTLKRPFTCTLHCRWGPIYSFDTAPTELTFLHHRSVARGCSIAAQKSVVALESRRSAKLKKKAGGGAKPSVASVDGDLASILSASKTVVQAVRHALVAAEVVQYVACRKALDETPLDGKPRVFSVSEGMSLPSKVILSPFERSEIPAETLNKLRRLPRLSVVELLDTHSAEPSSRMRCVWAQALDFKRRCQVAVENNKQQTMVVVDDENLHRALLDELRQLSATLLTDIDAFLHSTIRNSWFWNDRIPQAESVQLIMDEYNPCASAVPTASSCGSEGDLETTNSKKKLVKESSSLAELRQKLQVEALSAGNMPYVLHQMAELRKALSDCDEGRK